PGPDLRKPDHYHAVVSWHNRLVPGDVIRGKPVGVPKPVRAYIDKQVEIGFETLAKAVGNNSDLSIRDLYGPTQRFSVPAGKLLYIFKLNWGFGISHQFLILFDPKTGVITSEPPKIFSKWTDNFAPELFHPKRRFWRLLRQPLLKFVDIDGDGKP